MSTFEIRVLAEMEHLKRYARSITSRHADAEDLVQDTLYSAFKRSETFDPSKKMRQWLFGIMRNRRSDDLRKVRGIHVPLAEADFLSGPSEFYADVFDLKAALVCLPPHQLEAIHLIAVLGYTCAEAQGIVSRSANTLKSDLQRARKKLRQPQAA